MEIENLEKLLTDALEIVKELTGSSLLSLVNSDKWPESVDSSLICDENSEDEKLERAEFIIDSIQEPHLNGKKFLDFGCGEGHVVVKSKNQASFSVGYDILKQGNLKWEDDSLLLTTDIDKVKNNAPYDIILLYDVLDHCDNPTEVLSLLNNLLTNDGVVYIRVHPWCSRHGSHQYKTLNKAFIHLVFNQNELDKLGFKDDSKQKVIRPISTYSKIFEDSGFLIESFIKDISKVELFFENNISIKNRIMKTMNLDEWTTFQIEQDFIDYIVKKK